jgi:D-serine deaminase-like pyridoxal phosphate-dependent protein
MQQNPAASESGNGAAGDFGGRRSKESGEGLTRHDLPTPVLLVDLDLMEANIETMSRFVREASLGLRPHAKTHKCSEIARRQVEAGATGVCASHIGEAEAMADAGIPGILVTSELVGRNKIERLVRLTRRAPDTMSVVDNAAHAVDLNDAAHAAGISLNVLIDIDPAERRTGIPAGAAALGLAETIARLPGLRLLGLQCYSGDASHMVGFEARRDLSRAAMLPAIDTFRRLQELGMPVEIMSGGSTGTYNIDSALQGMTELQCGSYLFMDLDYARIGGRDGPVYDDFHQSLTVLATVISRSYKDSATVDAGRKAFSTDKPFGPVLKGISGVTYTFAGDEHGILELQDPSRDLRLGDRLEFVIPHCDPSVNLYDRIYALRGDRVEAVWPIARGY